MYHEYLWEQNQRRKGSRKCYKKKTTEKKIKKGKWDQQKEINKGKKWRIKNKQKNQRKKQKKMSKKKMRKKKFNKKKLPEKWD